MSSFYGNGGGGSGGSSGSTFDLSDRMAKGVDNNNEAVVGAVVEGDITRNKASGEESHAEGSITTASGAHSHAEGGMTTASGGAAHAEGLSSIASGNVSHAEGQGGSYQNAGVTYTSGATGAISHAEGYQTIAAGMADHSEGYQTRTTSNQPGNHAEGYQTLASGGAAHAEGDSTTASGGHSHAEGFQTIASGSQSHAEGFKTTASGDCSHAEGNSTTANHHAQHVFGEHNIPDDSTATAITRGKYVEIVGNGTSEVNRSNARTLDWAGNETLAGKLTVGAAPVNDMDVATKKYVDDNAGGSSFDLSDRIAKGVDDNGNVVDGAVIEGMVVETEIEGETFLPNKASGNYSHAEGVLTTASGGGAHTEGYMTTASSDNSHAEGEETTASGLCSHAEGSNTVASGTVSHAEGGGTVANHRSQHVFGEFNIADDSTAGETARGNYVEIVGNGTNNSHSNARTLDWSGNESLAGSLTLGMGTADEMTITAAQLRQLIEMLPTEE